MDAAGNQDGFTIVAVPEETRYELRDGETVVGFAEYFLTPDQVVFTHTVIDDTYGGLGLGAKLARFALDDAVSTGRRIVPLCSFIASFLRKNRDWDEHLEPSGGTPVD